MTLAAKHRKLSKIARIVLTIAMGLIAAMLVIGIARGQDEPKKPGIDFSSWSRVNQTVVDNTIRISVMQAQMTELERRFRENQDNNTWWFRALGSGILLLLATRITDYVFGKKVKVESVEDCPYIQHEKHRK